jgi:DNA-binding transcriptional ArsR family regulator
LIIAATLHRNFTMNTPAHGMTGACCPSLPAVGVRPTMRSLLELADLAKAIGHPARIQILHLLIEKNTCVAGDIFEKIPLAQSTVSQHLKVLRQSGFIVGCQDGTRMCYCVDPAVLVRFKELASGL